MPRSVMEHSFSEVPRVAIPRSSFNRSHGYKTTFDADYLIPVLCDDVIPGDTFNVDMHFFARLASPTVFPLMDNMHLESFFFFVPYRLVWDNWEKMHGAQDDPADSIDFTVPIITSASVQTDVGDLWDYFGLPHGYTPDDHNISALPFRAYRLIYNEWFRDQNLQDSVNVPLDNGPDTNSDVGFGNSPLKRGKRHDYFTSCLPWPQKGDAVEVPIGTSAPLYSTSTPGGLADQIIQDGVGSSTEMNLNAASTNLRAGGAVVGTTTLFADLSSATGATINDWRLAFQTQRLLERDARSGTRYNELILAHFGVTVPDFRVQRPEFLGGGSTPINISPVAQTTYQGTQTLEDAKGALSGIGTVSGKHGFTKSFVEHGVLIGLINVRGDITYSQGIERYWLKQTRYEFYYPVLSQIGEQAVEVGEIYEAAADPTAVFGYQERYAEMRYKPSRLTGLMAVDATGTLAAWHLSEDFASEPTLGSTFIESNTGTPLDRAISVPSEPQFIFDAYFSMQCARPMPLFGVPGNLDRF